MSLISMIKSSCHPEFISGSITPIIGKDAETSSA